jgi:dihydrofolate reductase
MLPVIYSMGVSLDGFMAGPDGDLSWSAPDADLFRFHIEQTRQLAACVCGRRLYEAMLVWETAEQTMSGDADFSGLGDQEAELEFARTWCPIPKVVFSRTLSSVEGNARLATDDVATELARLRDQPGEGTVEIGGANLAAAAIAEDLIDEYRLFVNPVVLGGGTPYFPPLEKGLDMRLIESRTFNSRVVYLRYHRAR